MNQNISSDRLDSFLTYINYKSTSRLQRMVISSTTKYTDIFAHVPLHLWPVAQFSLRTETVTPF